MRLSYFFLLLIIIVIPCSYACELPARAAAQKEISSDRCVICQESLEPQQAKAACANNHVIHSSCAIGALSYNLAEGKTVTCPQCRMECEDEFIKSLIRPQLQDLLVGVKDRTKNIGTELRDYKHKMRSI